MLVRPLHLLLGALCSLIAIFMIVVLMHAFWTVAQVVASAQEELKKEIVEKSRDEVSTDDQGVPKPDKPLGEEVREVMILPPADFLVRKAEDLPEEWAKEDEPEEIVAVKRIDEFTEAIGQPAQAPPEDTNRISSQDMAAGSELDAADPEGDDVPTTADGRDDERLNSLIDSELGEDDAPGNGGAGAGAAVADNPPTPPAIPQEPMVADASAGAAKLVEEVITIPGLDQVPVEENKGANDGESDGDTEADASGAGQPVVTPPAGGSGDIQRLKRRFKGRLDANGINSLSARGTPVGRYLAIISKRVTRNWQRACRDPINGQHITNGLIKAVLTIDSDGTVQRVTIEYSEGATAVQQNFTREAAEKTELPEFPADLRQELGNEPIEVVFSFLFFVG